MSQTKDFEKHCEEVEEECEDEGMYVLIYQYSRLNILGGWSNALKRVQTHTNFPSWPMEGQFYMFPNELWCRMVVNKRTGVLCTWQGNRTIALRNHVHSQHLPKDLTDRNAHLRTLVLVPGSHGCVNSRLFTRAMNIYCARASGGSLIFNIAERGRKKGYKEDKTYRKSKEYG